MRRKHKLKKSSAFAENLKSLKESKGWTQQQLADKIGVSQSTVKRWLDGTLPMVSNLELLAEANAVHINEFFLEINPEEKPVDSITQKSNTAGEVKSEVEKLIDRVSQKAESMPGAKADLARLLNVAPARISEWLSGKKEPGGEYTLRLLNWVEGRS